MILVSIMVMRSSLSLPDDFMAPLKTPHSPPPGSSPLPQGEETKGQGSGRWRGFLALQSSPQASAPLDSNKGSSLPPAEQQVQDEHSGEGGVALAVSPCARGHQQGDIPTPSLAFPEVRRLIRVCTAALALPYSVT